MSALQWLLPVLVLAAAVPYHPNASIYLDRPVPRALTQQLDSEIDMILKSGEANQKVEIST